MAIDGNDKFKSLDKPVKKRRLLNSINDISNPSAADKDDSESVIEKKIMSQIEKEIKLYNKIDKLESAIDEEYKDMRIPVIQSYSKLVSIVQNLDPESGGLYITYDLYNESLKKQNMALSYQNIDMADSITGIPQVDQQTSREERANKLNIPKEISTIIASTIGMKLLAILKQSKFMKMANAKQITPHGGNTTGPATAAQTAEFLITMALEFGFNQLPQAKDLMKALSDEVDSQIFEQGADELGVKEREEGRTASDKTAELIHGSPLEDYKYIIEYVADVGIGIVGGTSETLTSGIPKFDMSNESGTNDRLLMKPMLSAQKNDIENFFKQQRTWHPEQVEKVQLGLGERHKASELRATPTLFENSKPDDVWSRNNLPNPFDVNNQTDSNTIDLIKSGKKFNFIPEKHDVTDAFLDSINRAVDTMAYMSTLLSQLPVEMICCLSKFFASLDDSLLEKIRMILSLATNGVKLDLEELYHILQSNRNQALKRLILEPIIDLINKIFDEIIDEITGWMNTQLDKWDQMSNNCLSLDFLLDYIVDFIKKKRDELIDLMEEHFDDLLTKKRLGIGVLKVKADHDILKKLLKIINAIIDAKKKSKICREKQDKPTNDELEGFIRNFISDDATPFKLPENSSSDPFLSFNASQKFQTQSGISFPIDLGLEGKVDSGGEVSFSECASKISQDLIVKFSEFKSRIRDV
jgi:hypothetical protein